MAGGQQDQGLRGSVRRAVGDALDATVGRVGHTVGGVAVDVTGATAQQVIEELEPYLIQEAIPRIVDGVTPHLVDQVVPQVIDGVQGHLVEVTVPQVVEGMTPQLVDALIPQILDRLRPYLEQELVPPIVDALMPRLQAVIAPELVDALMPKIRDEVAPELLDALMPRIEAEIAPRLVDALMPKIRDEVAPELLDALMPRIEAEIAPQLVDALLPKIRAEVVPTILEDIVDDPRVRDLIREQSQGLFLDALESLRGNLAGADDLVERFGRRLLRRPPRPPAESAIALVLGTSPRGPGAVRHTMDELAARRREWQAMPMPPAPPGREQAYAGVVTRLLAMAVDIGLASWLLSQGLSSLVSLLNSIFGSIPGWLTVVLTGLAASLVPLYLALCWWLGGRTLGSWLMGTRVCTPDGQNPGIWRSLVRAWAALLGIVVWIISTLVSLFDDRRRSLLDILVRTEVRYVVPLDQQHRHIRETLLARRQVGGHPAVQVPDNDPAADRPVEEDPAADRPAADRPAADGCTGA
jgi:uncharacterized RDD family membrane protein YckC